MGSPLGPEGSQVSWGYVAVAAATVVSGYLGSEASKDAAAAAGQGYDAATAEQRRQFDLTRQDMLPWLNAGTDALGLQQRFLSGDQTAYTESPDHLWRLQQGRIGLDNSASSRGNLFGGGAQADVMNYNQGMATQGIDQWWNRLSGVSGAGMSTANQLGQFGQNYANQAGSNAIGAANARGSSYLNQAGQQQGAIMGLGNLFGSFMGGGGTNSGYKSGSNIKG